MSGNSKAVQAQTTKRKNGRGSRGQQYRAYSAEDRRWHNKLARLARRFAKSGLAQYQQAYESVLARSPLQVRAKYKTQKLAA